VGNANAWTKCLGRNPGHLEFSSRRRRCHICMHEGFQEHRCSRMHDQEDCSHCMPMRSKQALRMTANRCSCRSRRRGNHMSCGGRAFQYREQLFGHRGDPRAFCRVRNRAHCDFDRRTGARTNTYTRGCHRLQWQYCNRPVRDLEVRRLVGSACIPLQFCNSSVDAANVDAVIIDVIAVAAVSPTVGVAHPTAPDYARAHQTHAHDIDHERQHIHCQIMITR
jgi:hypothetical protein